MAPTFPSLFKKGIDTMNWKETAKYCEKTFGVYVNWEERFFICPSCEEPLYEEDWEEHNFRECPICEFNFYE